MLITNVQAQIEYGTYTCIKKCIGIEKSYSFGDKVILLYILDSGEYNTTFVGFKEKKWMLKGKWEVSKNGKKIVFTPSNGIKKRFKINENNVFTRRTYIFCKTKWNYQHNLD